MVQSGETIDAREVERTLQERFGERVRVQVVHPKREERQLVLIEEIRVDCRASAGGIRRKCQQMASAVGGELYGTVNLDFSGENGWTAEMVAEVPSLAGGKATRSRA